MMRGRMWIAGVDVGRWNNLLGQDGIKASMVARESSGIELVPLEDGHEPWHALRLLERDGLVWIWSGVGAGSGGVISYLHAIRPIATYLRLPY